MLDKIKNILEVTPGLKAREVARKARIPKKQVNSFLHDHQDIFEKGDDFCWSIIGADSILIEFTSGWINSAKFEEILASVGSPLDLSSEHIVFTIPKESKILLEAIARWLSLCNQLIFEGKSVTLKFADSKAFNYLNRIGFFDSLHNKIKIFPKKPEESAAIKYKGNNNAVVEFGEINLQSPNENIPVQLKRSFVGIAGKRYSQTAFTIITELFGNVVDHSHSPISGFAALQQYKGMAPCIQTVISDSGRGIIGTLRPILNKEYPDLARKFHSSDPEADALLVLEVFKEGRISQHGKSSEKARGLGLKRSSDMAAKFDAQISVRQETFELNIEFKNGIFNDYRCTLNMPRIIGTHICFKFLLD